MLTSVTYNALNRLHENENVVRVNTLSVCESLANHVLDLSIAQNTLAASVRIEKTIPLKHDNDPPLISYCYYNVVHGNITSRNEALPKSSKEFMNKSVS